MRKSIRESIPVALVAAASLAAFMSFTPGESEAALTTCGTGSSGLYVALGDSIVFGEASDDLATFGTQISYATLLNGYLRTKYGTTSFVNHGRNGDDTRDLLNALNGDAGMIDAVRRACVVTVCISGNNMLGCVDWPFWGCFSSGAKTCMTQGMDRAVGTAALASEYEQILARIRALNGTAALFIMTQYNPLKNANGSFLGGEWCDASNYRFLDTQIVRLDAFLKDATRMATYNYEIADVRADFVGRNASGAWKVCEYLNVCSLRDPHPNRSKGDPRIDVLHRAKVDD
jgi:hypothetical protein